MREEEVKEALASYAMPADFLRAALQLIRRYSQLILHILSLRRIPSSLDMTDIKRVGDSGVYTTEGMVAGNRAAILSKKREQEKAEYEREKNKIKAQGTVALGNIDDKFSSSSDTLEQEFRKRTIGLVTAEVFREARAKADNAKAEEQQKAKEHQALLDQKKKIEREKKRKKMVATLSFDNDEDGAEEDAVVVKKKVGKDKSVDTSYLPDRERDRLMEEERNKIAAEWLAAQEVIKKESLEVVYSYWDGSGHRKSTVVNKGMTVGKFLEKIKGEIVSEFPDLRSVSADDLMYIKEDLIIPSHFSFYDLIITKARGKSGPLFHFDVHDDIRMVSDVRVEKDESHPGKIVERRWYEKNKHIFPASRWEIYDPAVERGTYTIHGDEVNHDPLSS